MSNLENKRPLELLEKNFPSKRLKEALHEKMARLKVFNEKMALVGFGEGQTVGQQNSPQTSQESSQRPWRYNEEGQTNPQSSLFAPIQNTYSQPPSQASFGQPQQPTWDMGAPAPSTNTSPVNSPDISHSDAQPRAAGRVEDRSLRDIILSVLQETQQQREAHLAQQPASTQAPIAANPAACQGDQHTTNTAHTIRKGEPPVFVHRLHLKIKTEVSPGNTTKFINAVSGGFTTPDNSLSPVAGFAKGTYIGVISDTNRNAIIAATEMALNECKLPNKRSWFLTGPEVNPPSHEYTSVLLRSCEDPVDEYLQRAAKSNEKSEEFHSMRGRIAALEIENQQLRERNQQLEEENQDLKNPSHAAI